MNIKEEKDFESHDCHLSPMDGCSGCEEYYVIKQKEKVISMNECVEDKNRMIFVMISLFVFLLFLIMSFFNILIL